jgi:CHAD domain-containing protein
VGATRKGKKISVAKRQTRTIAATTTAVAVGGALAAGKLVHDVVADRAGRKRARRFRLDRDETVRVGIGRVASGQLELAIGLIDGREGEGPEAIHEARKALKRLRAVLRLCRPWLGEERFRQENSILRDAGRSLSDVRDAQVLVETLDGLGEPVIDELPIGTWSTFRDALVADAQALEDAGLAGERRANVVTALVGVRERVAVWPLPDDAGSEALAEGLKRVYAKARRARRRAQHDPAPEKLHELRKRTKDVWHAGQLLTEVSPKRIRKLRRRAHRLSDVLGTEHDLTVLCERAEATPDAFGPGGLELLRTLAERRRRALRREALTRAAKLYRRKPRKLVHRLSAA